MSILVSSRYHYLSQNPDAKISNDEIKHELVHLKRREQLSGFVALGTLALSVLALTGVIGGGTFILGALLAIAGVATVYACCCRQAESNLREKQIEWLTNEDPEILEEELPQETAVEKAKGISDFFGFLRK